MDAAVWVQVWDQAQDRSAAARPTSRLYGMASNTCRAVTAPLSSHSQTTRSPSRAIRTDTPPQPSTPHSLLSETATTVGAPGESRLRGRNSSSGWAPERPGPRRPVLVVDEDRHHGLSGSPIGVGAGDRQAQRRDPLDRPSVPEVRQRVPPDGGHARFNSSNTRPTSSRIVRTDSAVDTPGKLLARPSESRPATRAAQAASTTAGRADGSTRAPPPRRGRARRVSRGVSRAKDTTRGYRTSDRGRQPCADAALIAWPGWFPPPHEEHRMIEPVDEQARAKAAEQQLQLANHRRSRSSGGSRQPARRDQRPGAATVADARPRRGVRGGPRHPSQGVTPWPQEITRSMAATIAKGRAGVDAIARTVGADVWITDVGMVAPVDHPAIRQRAIAGRRGLLCRACDDPRAGGCGHRGRTPHRGPGGRRRLPLSRDR